MDVRDIVKGHYGGANLEDAILRALSEVGLDTSALGARDLAPVDELHAGGVLATEHLLSRLELDAASRLLDIGCGVGGPARIAASTYACHTTGVDLTPEFVSTASALTARVGLSELMDFEVAPGDELPFADASFDRAMMIHVGMNIPDKVVVFAEVRRVLEPGGRFAVYEQMHNDDGELPYPMPWAEDERSSFVASAQEYGAFLEGAGFEVVQTEDRTAAGAGPPQADASGLTPQAVFGPVFVERIGNNVAATKAGLLNAVLVVAQAI